MQNIPTFLQGIQKQSYDPTAEVNKPFLQPSPTEQKIKQIATQNQPKAKERKTSFTPDEFVNSVDTFIANNPGITEDEALDFVENHYKEKGFTVEGMEFSQPVEPVEESGNTTLMSRLQESGEKRLEQSQEIESSDRNAFRKLLDKTALKAGSFSDIVGAGIGEAFETSGQLLSAITPDSVEDKVKNEVQRQFEQVTGSTIGKTLGTTAQGVGYTAKEVYDLLPENVQKDVESLGTIGLGILDAVGVGYTAKATKNLPGAVKDTVGKKNFLTQGTRDAYIAKETEKINKVTGQLSQPGKKQLGDVEAMKKSLSTIDTEDIGTYEDLSNRFSDKITAIAAKQDELLPSEKIYEISSLGTKSKGGTIEVNFIENALDDMEKLYEKVGEIDNLERVRELRAGKLSVKDINDIAREYNVNFGKKAFNKDGSAKFSDIGQAFENTRKGVKEQARGLLPDDTMKVLDSELSDLYSARNLSDNMVDKVQVLRNRIDERGFIANLSNKAGKIIDILTLGAPKELFSSMLLKGGMGKATLDSLTLQNRLTKNIKLIEKSLAKIEKAKDARVASEILENLATQIGLTREQINAQASKTKDSLGDLADNVADRTGARAKFVDDGGTGISGKIDAPKELIEEAKKYKSAEEFVKSQGEPLYHGSNNSDVLDNKGFYGKGNEPRGTFLTRERDFASAYGEPVEVFTNNVKIASKGNLDSLGINPNTMRFDDFKEAVLNVGFDGYDLTDFNKEFGFIQDETIILNPEKLITKGQLKEIYNQANK